MKLIIRSFLLLLLLSVFSCKKNKEYSEIDNIFKFKEYIVYNTYGNQSITTDIRVELAKPIQEFDLTQEISNDYLKISPKTDGKLIIENGKTLIFQPSERLKPDTEYTAILDLKKLYSDIPKEFKTYTFSFKTLAPNFKVGIDNLQSYNREFQYVEAWLETSDIISLKEAKQLVSASQDGKKLRLKWQAEEDSEGKYFNFNVDSIVRKNEDSEIQIKWDGKSIKAKNKGENKFEIPGKNNFKIVDVKTSLSPQTMMKINFSDPIQEGQNFAGLVSIENSSNLRYEVMGNVLYVYPPNRIVGDVKVNVFAGIKNSYGSSLKNEFSELISFEELKPEVRMISKGVVLPNSASTPVYFEAVNLSKVDVRVIKIFENNVLQFLQSYNLNDHNSYDIKRVGRRITKTTIDLNQNKIGDNGSWKAYAINLSEYFAADPGAIYQLELSFKKDYILNECSESSTEINEEDEEDDEYDYYDEEYGDSDLSDSDEESQEERYWDNEIYNWRKYNYNWEQRDNPCHQAYYNEDRIVTTNILGSDLGFIVKKGANQSYNFITTNLISAKPESGVKIKLFNFQQQLIQSLTSDSNGMAKIDSESNAAFAVAQKGNNYAYVKLEGGNALSMSNFDIAGKELQRGLKAFTYTDRGVYRPGDSIHFTFVLNDKANPLPKNHPVTLEVTDTRGKLVQRSTLNRNDSYNRGVVNDFYYFPILTDADAATGNWNATVTVGGAQFSHTLKLASIKPNRLKLSLDFEDKILDASKPINGIAKAMWLHGSPARNLRIDMAATLRASSSAFPKYVNYNFIDPVRTFEEVEIPMLDTQLSSEGSVSFSKKIEVGKTAPGMLTATFLTKVYEGGGDFSMDVFTKDLVPFTHFVGLKSPEAGRYGSYFTGKDNVFEVQSVNAQGDVSGNRELQVKVYEIEWRWWWNRGEDNLSSYENSSFHRPIDDFRITTNANGKGNFTVNIPEERGGRYLIRVFDSESGHATGRIAYFYRDWSQRPTDGNAESAKMLLFAADKDKYEVGEKAIITFPSGSEGRALISVENGSEVLQTHWVETKKGETQATIKITKEMAPNIYVNISLLQPHNQVKNDLPIRLYGVVPILVEDPSTLLHPKLVMPKTLRPEEKYTIKVSEENKKAMTYTIAIVDEGLLDLTRFTTPDIHDAMYSREALGVKTFDMFDYVIGAYSGSVDNIYAIGGGDAAVNAKNRKADRFKPVVTYLGPFQLAAGKTASHEVLMPNYIGSVKVMLVAGDNTKAAYGKTDQTIPVRKPLMVLASLPRKLSPGEKVVIPVTVFVMENKIKNVEVSIKTGSGLKALEGNSKRISFSEPGEKIVNFEFDVLPSEEIQTIEVSVSGNGEKASYSVEIDVENPNPITQRSTIYTISGNEQQSFDFTTFGVPRSNGASLEFSTLPPMDFSKRMEWLIRYPYGCLEQITSAAFPQLFLSDVFEITFDKKQEIEKNVTAAIERLGRAQTTNGGFAYWPGERESDEWSTNYGGHFLLEAKQKGYALPISLINNWLQYQQNMARQWRSSNTGYNSSLNQAYRLYTLALAGKPELAVMNRLRETKDLSNDAKWRLAAAYALAGKKSVGQEIAATANINFVPERYDYYTYGSPFRNRAMALETLVLLDDPKQRDLSISLAKQLSSKQWLSTQETSYGLLAMAKMLIKNGGKALDLSYNTQGKSFNIKTDRPISRNDLSFVMGVNPVKINNKKDNVVYVTLSQYGKLPLGEELAERRNLSVKSTYYDAAGKILDISSLRQGTEIIAKVSVSNISSDPINNVALAKIFPSGWEIVNTSFTELGGGAAGNARYTDIRDDRVNFFFDLNRNESKTFTIKLNASYLGNYYLPGTQAEGMYDNTYYARDKGMWVKVE